MEDVWEVARAQLAGLPDGRGLNIAYEALDRHVDEGHGDRVALRCVALDESVEQHTYRDLQLLTNRFASMLDGPRSRSTPTLSGCAGPGQSDPLTRALVTVDPGLGSGRRTRGPAQRSSSPG